MTGRGDPGFRGAVASHDPAIGSVPYPRGVERAITGYHRDDAGDWVAELVCGHDQHVRHRPPFQLRDWILADESRAARLGTPLECPLCQRGELPEGARWVRTTPVFDQGTLPPGLRETHRVVEGKWARIVVHEGRLLLHLAYEPAITAEVQAGSMRAIPPDVGHALELVGPVRLAIEFFAVDRTGRDRELSEDDGGDAACWAGSLCPECGCVRGDRHRLDCPLGDAPW